MGEILVALYLAAGAAAPRPPSGEIELRCEHGTAVFLDGVDVGTCLDGRLSIKLRPGKHRVAARAPDGLSTWRATAVLLDGERAAFEVDFGAVGNTAPVLAAAMAVPPLPSGVSYATAMSDAKTAYARGQYARALAAAEDALRAKPGDSQATALAAISACNSKNRGDAQKHINNLSGQRQNMARQSCKKNGVPLP